MLLEAQAAPCPPLFVVERSTNRNVVLYEARFRKDGKLDEDEPVRARWRMLEKGPEVYEGLTWLERGSAYGVDVREAKDGQARIIVKALKDHLIEVEALPDACPRAAVELDGKKRLQLEKVFVKVSGGIFPSVEKVTLTGRSIETGLLAEETLKP